MEQHLSKYAAYLRGGLDEWTAKKLTREALGECDLFFEGLSLGVNPRETVPRKGENWVKAFTRAVHGARKKKERDRLHNQNERLKRGKTLPHVEMYPSTTPPYMPQHMRDVFSHIHDDILYPQVVKECNGELIGKVAYFPNYADAETCKKALKAINVLCGKPQKQFSSKNYAFELHV